MEIYWSGTWGAISDSSWTAAEANVACRQLQHSVNGNFFSLLLCSLRHKIEISLHQLFV